MTPMNKQRAYLLLMDKLEPFQNYSQVKFLKGVHVCNPPLRKQAPYLEFMQR